MTAHGASKAVKARSRDPRRFLDCISPTRIGAQDGLSRPSFTCARPSAERVLIVSLKGLDSPFGISGSTFSVRLVGRIPFVVGEVRALHTVRSESSESMKPFYLRAIVTGDFLSASVRV